MKLTIRVDGRSIGLVLPDSGDVEVDLTGGAVSSSGEDVPVIKSGSLDDVGPSAKRMYRWIVQTATDGETSVDPVIICEQLQFTAIGLGRIMGRLTRMGLIESRRKRDASGRTLRYDVKLLRIVEENPMEEGIDSAKTLWVTTQEDIEAECGSVGRDLFVALCKMADIDGNVAAPPSEVMEMMDGTTAVFPSMKLGELEDGGWVLISDDSGDLSVAVLGFDKLKESFTWRGQQPLPSPE